MPIQVFWDKGSTYEQQNCPVGRWKTRRWRECWEEKEDNLRYGQQQTVRACSEVSSGQQGFVRGFYLGTSVSSVRADITVKSHYSQAANPMFLSCLIPSGKKPAGQPTSFINCLVCWRGSSAVHFDLDWLKCMQQCYQRKTVRKEMKIRQEKGQKRTN